MGILRLNTLASGSAGNSHLLCAPDGSALALEAGVTFKKMQKFFLQSNVTLVLITHEHGDHCKSAKNLLADGYNVYCSKGTKQALDIPLARVITPGHVLKLGGFRIFGFPVHHDAAEPLNFVIEYGNERWLFITDTSQIPFTFKGINHMILEVNYVEELITDEAQLSDRIKRSHVGLKDAITFLEKNDNSALKSVHLTHLSDRNSDKRLIVDAIKAVLAPGVSVSTAGD